MAKGILIAAMNIGNAAEDEFHDWYDTEHLPERQRVPGFLLCQCWIGAADPKISVATYDLDNVSVLQSPGYQAIGGENLSPWSKRVTSQVERLMRFEGDQVLPGDKLPPDNAGGFLLNAINVEPAAEAEFNEWYNTEHIPALSAVPGCLRARRFRATSANRRYVALYHLASPEVQATQAWKSAADTEWTRKLRRPFRGALAAERHRPRDPVGHRPLSLLIAGAVVLAIAAGRGRHSGGAGSCCRAGDHRARRRHPVRRWCRGARPARPPVARTRPV